MNTKIKHRRDPIKTIDRPAGVPFMVQIPMSGKVQGTYEKGGILVIDGQKLKIMAIRKVEVVGKTIKIIGKGFPFEEVGKP